MALRALSIAATGGRAMMERIDTITNNLANVNTTAYKKTRANFADLLSQQVHRAGLGDAARNRNPAGEYFGTGVRLVSTEKLFDQGALQHTKRDLDVAIEGEGFFRVLLPDQTTAYTRAGRLNIDSQGNLVTSTGRLLDPPITISRSITRICIDATGLVQGFDPAAPETLEDVGQLELTRFVSTSGLEALGDNLYRRTPAAGGRIDGQPGQGRDFGLIRQGFLERSNVDVIKELMDLIQAQRALEINSKSIEMANQILQNVNNIRK